MIQHPLSKPFAQKAAQVTDVMQWSCAPANSRVQRKRVKLEMYNKHHFVGFEVLTAL
jgi:hypothetical protein